jgi:hypothetical protein
MFGDEDITYKLSHIREKVKSILYFENACCNSIKNLLLNTVVKNYNFAAYFLWKRKFLSSNSTQNPRLIVFGKCADENFWTEER